MKFISALLWNLGLHIGTYNYLTTRETFKYILGIRNNIVIIDPQSIYFQLRTSTRFLNELGKQASFLIFFHSRIEFLPMYIKLFLLNLINIQHRQACVEQKWSYGQLSNHETQMKVLLTSLFYLDAGAQKNEEGYTMYELFYRLLFFTIYKRLEGISWMDTYDSVKKYWRFFYYFKFYSFTEWLPDSIVYINNKNFNIPIKEAESQSIPVIHIANNSIELNASYILISNNTGYLISIFYFVLFIYSYIYGFNSIYLKLNKKNKHKKKYFFL